MNIKHSRRSGFSLIELLVAIAIMGVVMTIGMKMFSTMMDQWRVTKTMSELEDHANTVFEYFEQDLSDILSAEVSGISLVGEDRVWEGKGFKRAPDQDDRITIPIQGVRIKRDKATAKQVVYEIERTDSIANLRRTSYVLGTDKLDESPLNLLNDVDALVLDIQYATGSGWVNEWNESTLPKAVRVGIVVAKRGDHHYQISRKAVYTVAVQ